MLEGDGAEFVVDVEGDWQGGLSVVAAAAGF